MLSPSFTLLNIILGTRPVEEFFVFQSQKRFCTLEKVCGSRWFFNGTRQSGLFWQKKGVKPSWTFSKVDGSFLGGMGESCGGVREVPHFSFCTQRCRRGTWATNGVRTVALSKVAQVQSTNPQHVQFHWVTALAHLHPRWVL